MRISALNEYPIGILGMGVEGQSVFRALRRAGHPGPIIALADTRNDFTPEGLRWRHGAHQRQGLDESAVIVRSPGFPLHHPTLQAIQRRGLPMTTATNLFLAEARAADLPVIGITGSKGKSTTATLAHRALLAADRPAALVGNIGDPALDQLEEIRETRAAVVFEMSSYQCNDLTLSPSIAVLLDLFPEHMDWHGSVAAYYDAKLNIARYQRLGDRFVYNYSSRIWEEPLGVGEAIAVNSPEGLHFSDGWFREGQTRRFSDAGMLLRGIHQRRNAVSAFAAVALLGVGPQAMQHALKTFAGLPHRNEDLGTFGGVRWFDDAISTAPEAAVAALAALGPDAHTLIVGGMDRGYDFAPLAAALRAGGAQVVITIPDSGRRLSVLLEGSGVVVEDVESLEVAVARAAALTPAGATCVFSPASPSYNRFRSFKERGACFQDLVRALPS